MIIQRVKMAEEEDWRRTRRRMRLVVRQFPDRKESCERAII